MAPPQPKLRAPQFCLLLVWSILVPRPAVARQGQPVTDTLVLTLEAAQQLAIRRSPAFAAAAQAAAFARGELREARRLPNPDFELEAPGVSGSGLGNYQAILGQTVEWAGQRGLRIAAADRGVTRARWEVRNEARKLILDVSLTYLEAAAAARRLDLAQRVLDLNERLLMAVRAQLAEGKISSLEANLAEIEFGRARGHVLAGRREMSSATYAIKQLIGLDAEQPVRVILPGDSTQRRLPAEDSLLALALRNRPDLAAAAAVVDQASQHLRLARREAIPALSIGPMAERDEAGGGTRIGLAVGLPLPLWNWNGGAVAQRSADVERARHERVAAELTVRSEVREARQALASAREEVETMRTSVLQPVQENQRLLEIAYQAGKIDLPSVLLVRNQLLEAETEYWDAWLAREQARLRLEAATASFDLDAVDVGEEPR